MAAGEQQPGLGVVPWLVADPELNRIQSAPRRHLVDRGLEREHARGFPGRAQPAGGWDVDGGDLVGGPPVGRGIHQPGADRGLLGVLLDPRARLHDVVCDRGQPPGRVGSPAPTLAWRSARTARHRWRWRTWRCFAPSTAPRSSIPPTGRVPPRWAERWPSARGSCTCAQPVARTRCSRMEREPLGFPPSFAPRPYERRTSGWGQATEHGPNNALSHRPSLQPCVFTQCVRPRVALVEAAVSS